MKRSREPEEDNPTSPAPTTTVNWSSGPNSPVDNTISYDEAASPPAAKITELDPSSSATNSVEMRCSFPPHKEPLVFATYDEYESHYHKTHTNRCLDCRKNFPSAHLLGIHIEEMHDSFAAVKRERGERTVSQPPLGVALYLLTCMPQYSCFVEGCERKCSTPQKRRMHLIDKHLYPKNFFFAVTRDGIDGRRSLLIEGGHRRRRSSVAAAATAAAAKAQPSSQPTVNEEKPKALTAPKATIDASKEKAVPDEKPDVVMDDLAGAMSALQFVPPSIRFGRGGRKAGFAKR